MKYIKTFESFSPVNEEEEAFSIKKLISGESAYKSTINFLNDKNTKAKFGGSDVVISDKVKELWQQIKDSKKSERDPSNLKIIQSITSLGKSWAEQNKKTKTENEYGYNAVDTVMKSDYGRDYRGGGELHGTKKD